ncbi:magnesium transporter [candidate division KSB1 bacterium]
MQIQMQQTADTIRRLIRREAMSHLRKILDKTHPADIAHFSRFFTEKERNLVFGLLLEEDMDKAAVVLAEMDVMSAVALLENRTPEMIRTILQTMDPDDQVDLIDQLPEEISNAVLQLMKKAESEQVESLLTYGKNTAGGIMNTKYLALNEEMTIKEAIEALHESQDIEMLFYLYVVDDRNHLVGVLSMRQLILKPPNTKLKNVMEDEVMRVHTDTDQEEVARQVARYNFLAIPVVDDENKMLGVVTVDDTIDVLREEATEDFMKMVGTSTEEILEPSVVSSLRLRSPWLLTSLLGGIIAATVIIQFESMIGRIIVLSAFLPVITGMGGNVGIQSTTLMVRGIATGRINVKHIWNVLKKEIAIGLISGIGYGLLLGILTNLAIQIGILSSVSPVDMVKLSIVVGIGLFASMFAATTVGTFIPLVLEKIKIDPALASGPFVTTAIDIFGVGSYLLIARIFFL